jgi:uncharacterized membrane protein
VLLLFLPFISSIEQILSIQKYLLTLYCVGSIIISNTQGIIILCYVQCRFRRERWTYYTKSTQVITKKGC